MGWWSALWGLPVNEGVERLPDPTSQTRADETPPVLGPEILPPPRVATTSVSLDRSLSLIPVYRAVSIIATAVSSLTIDLWRGADVLPTAPTWVRQPDVKTSRSAFFEMTTTSLACNGNAFWKVVRQSPADQPSALIVLDPTMCHVSEDGSVSYRGEDLQRWQVQHLALLRIPGRPRGLGPIQAAAADLASSADIRDYASNWFTSGNVPNGTLTTEQHITVDQAVAMKMQWLSSVRGGEPAVLGQGLTYEPMLLSPKDAQFLESRQFSVTDIARLFGIPAHMLLSVVEGGSMTYMSGQAADLSFSRWTLTQYLREIEEAFTSLLPRGQVARFNMDAVLRPATKERYEAHQIAIKSGFLTRDEVRAIEGLRPLNTPAPQEAS